MAFVFRIKRRLAGEAGPPDSLQVGELAFNEVDNTLYYGRSQSISQDTSSTSVSSISSEIF
jgi:hypothetical protein